MHRLGKGFARCAGYLALGLSLASAAERADAQISFTGSYSENFDTLGSSGGPFTNVGGTNPLPTGFASLESGTNANASYAVGTGSLGTGDTYSFGATGAADRALGGLQSGTLIPLFGANITNNTGALLSDITVGYTGEQWRLGALARADRLDFQYSTDATSLGTGTWLDFNALDFVAPTVGPTVGALDGNLAANRTVLSQTITGLNVANGGNFWVRWQDFNATGADDGLAVDNFSLSAGVTAVPEPATYALIGLGVSLGLWRMRRRTSQTPAAADDIAADSEVLV